MRFLGIGEACELGDLYLRLAQAGHEVRVFIADQDAQAIFEGLIAKTSDWQNELAWIREAGIEGIILFECVGQGEIQDRLRREGFQVIGGSAFADRLELERAVGQALLASLGLKTAQVHSFSRFDDAIDFVRRTPRRWVFKLDGKGQPSWRNYVGVLEDGRDVLAMLELERSRSTTKAPVPFILMEHLTGVEMGVGAYFNGDTFLTPACLDWEHKRFFPGDLGELTGEMGTLVSYRNAEPLFEATLRKLEPTLRDAGHVGYVNLNCIVNEAGIWPLELTCRFGYPGFAILEALHQDEWAVILGQMVQRDSTSFRTVEGYAVGVVVTVPPFPLSGEGKHLPSAEGLPICFKEVLSSTEQQGLHWGEVASRAGQLFTTGPSGYVLVVTGKGATVEAAQQEAYALVRKVVVANARYRVDIGDKFLREDRATLRRGGYPL